MEVILTGIPELDLAFGGGIIKGGLVLISHESDLQGSIGWIPGLRIFQGDLGVLSNYRYPSSRIFNQFFTVGMSAE